MKRIRFIHWNAEEAMERTARLVALGHEVLGDTPPEGASVVKELRRVRPQAVVIDLSRLPAHGREIGRAMRLSSTLRAVPIVYVGGDPAKREIVRALLPDATYTTWERIGPDLARTLENPPSQPHVPPDHPGANTSRPVTGKLGFKTGMTVALVGAPAPVAESLRAESPAGVAFRNDLKARADLALFFAADTDAFGRALRQVSTRADLPAFWIAWPKLASGVKTDLTQGRIRDAARDAGFVDSKICGIDAVWSGLRFSRMRQPAVRREESFE
jgi:hypothetical protein